MQLTSKLPAVGTTIFTEMSQLAAEHGAINLSQGFPDFPVDERLRDLFAHYVRAGHNQYAPMAGLPGLRVAIADKAARCYGYRPDPVAGVTITSGATEAIFSAITALTGAGDEVVYFEPAYDCYVPAVRLSGATPVPIRLRAPDYRMPWAEVADRVTDRTRLLIINNPHNPTGTVLAATDLDALTALLDRHPRLLVVADEVYQHLVYDGRRHESVLRYPAIAARAVVAGSFGKTFHATGWRVGYAVAPAPLTAELRKVHQFNTFSVIRPVQHALADYLADPTVYERLPDFFARKRQTLTAALAGTGFEPLPSAGTYFMLARYGALSDRDDRGFAHWLTRERGVAVIPVSAFYTDGTDEGVVRFCFAKQEATLRAAGQRLRNGGWGTVTKS